MGYYMAGDYYSRGGILSSIGGALRKVGSAAIGGAVGLVTGGPIAAASNVIRSIAPATTVQPTQLRIPQMTVTPSAFLPGGQPLLQFGRKRRRMNYANGRALSRANRRVDGFVRLARRSLKHTGYKIVSKGAGKKRVSISEHGPGSVNVRG